ncbi:MAG TPA: alpha/beta hydrolase-fold protein [Solimonas sp.]|nr:alpha/beta hydrolase-fold protein [Solimonas sp.]
MERRSIPAAGALRELRIALPDSYASAKRRRYPLVIVLDADGLFGSAVEMSRMMAFTSEVRESIVVGLQHGGGERAADTAEQTLAEISSEILPWICSHYRVGAGEVALFGAGAASVVALQGMLGGIDGIDHYIIGEQDFDRCSAEGLSYPARGGTSARRLALTAATGKHPGRGDSASWNELGRTMATLANGNLQVSVNTLEDIAASSVALPALLHGLRQFWSTRKTYGEDVTSLRQPLLMAVLERLSPLFRLLNQAPPRPVDIGNPWLLHSESMGRHFEVFVALPASYREGATRRYPALVVLDATIEFSTAAESAAVMAAAGDIDELIVIGIGVPRSEGPRECGFRRLEEFSPPVDGYAFNDDLGRILRSMYSMRGQDARERLGRAPEFLKFLSDELLPRLQGSLRIDSDDLGLLGHSAGGTFVAWALMQQDSPFRRYFAVSPGVGISGFWLLRQPDTQPVSSRAECIVLTLGSEEKTNLFNRIAGIPDTDELARRLQGLQPQLEVRYRCFEGETHSSIYPRAVALSLAAGYPGR